MAVLAIVVVGIAAGRSRSGSGSDRAAVRSAPHCAQPAQRVNRPDAVPAELLPSGTVLTSRMNLPEQRTLVTGVIPLAFPNAVHFYSAGLPKAGYQLGLGDAEMTEAEALFLGARVSGKWKVNGIPNCAGAVTLTLMVEG